MVSILIIINFFLLELIRECSCLGVHTSPQEFCYSDSSCGPRSKKWPDKCQKGKHQSPIDIHVTDPFNGNTYYEVLPLQHLDADHFFLNNNGHTLNMDVTSTGEGSRIFPGYGLSGTRFKLANVHFHWGSKNHNGSEHCINGKAYSMEVHFVHFKAIYGTIAKAVASRDPHALTVVAVFLQVDERTPPNPALKPILRNLDGIRIAAPGWEKVDEAIDLTPILPKEGIVYCYRGSLTTPPCTENVNWFVFAVPTPISPLDVKAFRSLQDENGQRIGENHRPLQHSNHRKIDTIGIVKDWD